MVVRNPDPVGLPEGPHHSGRQTAERYRGIWREGADDGVAAGQQRPVQDTWSAVLIGGVDQEMRRGPVSR